MTLPIDTHRSTREQTLDRETAASLRANHIEPKFLYLTPHQAELWRRVFLKHSPIHANPDFTRIYRDAFTKACDLLRPGKQFLVGLGCGTGLKELDLHSHLKARGHDVLFSAIDVSHDLVVESAQRLIDAGAQHEKSLVCDLNEAIFLGDWINRTGGNLPRLITFFGLFPNFVPSLITRLFRAVLRPGDLLLASTHLAPIQPGTDLDAAMNLVLPQYDNPETLAWLNAALEQWQLQNLVGVPAFHISSIEGIPAFIASSRWKSKTPFEKWGQTFSPSDEPLRLFYSLRYTPLLFEKLMLREGFRVELLSITSCLQEAIWSIRLA